MKRIILSFVLLIVLLFTAAAAENGTAPVVFKQGDVVTLVDGPLTDDEITDFDDAAGVVEEALGDLGGNERTEFVPWRTLTDAFGNHYYVFQQMYNNTTVLGGAVKVITDAKGHMIGLTSSIEADLPQTDVAGGITAWEAEEIVIEHQKADNARELTIQDGLTDKMILPVALDIESVMESDNLESNEIEGSRYVWVVYTDNPDSSMTKGSDLPYLAHYVTLDGQYLYSLPTMLAGDEAGASGFDSSYVFEFMEPVEYTGYVDLTTGGEKEITVTVMRDKRTGMYYLGNIERRIVVADCWEFLYNKGRVVLASSPDNLEWDQVGLQAFYNYCRAYDYYREIGWKGGDGLETPIIILNDYCDKNHVPVNNAAYVGGYLGWQIFLASQCNDFSQSLDILAHEFTHCVTSSVMTYNAYMNDYGAINEAMSDIQGKTCEMMMDGRENTTWALGDKSSTAVRNMEDPHQFQQPQFTWDLYYVPNVKTPTILNDLGGVHGNSSLLNYLAWYLYEKGGMTLEEGRAFWFTVDCAMVPGTDYPQLAQLLPWALKATGLERLESDLKLALEATRLGVKEMPKTYDEDRALLTMSLPDTEAFNDGNWVMMLWTLNTDKLMSSVTSIFGHVMMGDFSVLPPSIGNLLSAFSDPAGSKEDTTEEKKSLAESIADVLKPTEETKDGDTSNTGKADEEESLLERLLEGELGEWLKANFSGVLYNADTNAGQDGLTMRVVTIPGHSLPMLIHGIWNENISTLEDNACLIYLAGQWIDLSMLDKISEEEIDKTLKEYTDKVMADIENVKSINDALDLFLYRIESGKINTLPSEGLETMNPGRMDAGNLIENPETPTPRKSRPKLETKEEPAEQEESELAA